MTDPTGRDLLDERMDQRLKEYGARWRDALPMPAEPWRAETSRIRRWLVPAAAAAAVVAVLGVTYSVTSGGSEQSADPTGPDAPGSCQRDALKLESDSVSEHQGYRYAVGRLVLTGTATCVIEGYPEVVLRGNGSLPRNAVRAAPDGPPAPVIVSRSSAAIVIVRVALSGFDCLTADNDSIHVTMPNGDAEDMSGVGGLCEPGGAAIVAEVLPITSEDDESDSAPDAVPGTVTGTITLDGGPAPGVTMPLTAGEVTFTSRDGATGAGTSINPDGTYEIELPPGAYDIEVTSPEYRGLTCRDGAGVTGGTVNEINISCPIE